MSGVIVDSMCAGVCVCVCGVCVCACVCCLQLLYHLCPLPYVTAMVLLQSSWGNAQTELGNYAKMLRSKVTTVYGLLWKP